MTPIKFTAVPLMETILTSLVLEVNGVETKRPRPFGCSRDLLQERV